MIRANLTVSRIAMEKPSAAKVFDRVGIAYCCDGWKTLNDACSALGLSADDVIRALDQAAAEDIATALQAVTLLGELTGHNRHAFLQEYALSMRVLGDLQSEAGQHEAALASGREEISSFRELTEYARDVFLSDLARSVSHLTLRLKKASQSEDALATAQEAVNIYRELVERDRDRYLAKLSVCLNILARFQGEAGRLELATTCTREAVTIYLELLERDFDIFIDLYVTSCESLGKLLICGLPSLTRRCERRNICAQS